LNWAAQNWTQYFLNSVVLVVSDLLLMVLLYPVLRGEHQNGMQYSKRICITDLQWHDFLVLFGLYYLLKKLLSFCFFFDTY